MSASPYISLIKANLASVAFAALFLGFFAVSRWKTRQAFARAPKEKVEEMALEFGRYTRLFLLSFGLLAVALLFLFGQTSLPPPSLVKLATVGLSLILTLSHVLTRRIVLQAGLPPRDLARFRPGHQIGVAALIALYAFIASLFLAEHPFAL